MCIRDSHQVERHLFVAIERVDHALQLVAEHVGLGTGDRFVGVADPDALDAVLVDHFHVAGRTGRAARREVGQRSDTLPPTGTVPTIQDRVIGVE